MFWDMCGLPNKILLERLVKNVDTFNPLTTES